MMKYFGIYSKQQVYVGTIAPMPPVMGVRKTSSDKQGMCEHVWLKVFLNKPMQECRDVKKSQVSTNYSKKAIVI